MALAATLSRWSAEPAAALDPNDVVLGSTNPGSGTVATTTSINANVAAPGLSVNNSNVLDTGGAIQATAALSFGISARSGPGAALQFRNTGVIGAASGAVLPSDTSDNRGVYGSASNVGVHGYSATGTGVRGETASTNSAVSGVVGSAVRGPGVTGGSGSGPGVFGGSNGGPGVFGQAINLLGMQPGVLGTSSNGPGVQGTSDTAFGVQGLSQNAYGVSGNSTTQAGIWGSSNTNVGVLGTSTSGVGVNGVSSSSNGVNALSTSGIGMYASCSGGLAGRFDGNVLVNGNLTVTGTFPMSSAVAHPDGTLRRVFGLETPEAFYEDIGQGSLTGGVGYVSLDPDFAALVRADAYQVFLTAYGENRGLYISSQSASGFEVREVAGGTSSIGFGYRVVARPKNATSPRLDRVTVPPAPAQPRLDHVEPLDVPARMRDLPTPRPGGQPAAPTIVRDGQSSGPSR